jgi:hypothetical protein
VYPLEILSKKDDPLRDFDTNLIYPLPTATVDGTKYYIF